MMDAFAEGPPVIHAGRLWRWSGGGSASWFFVTIDGEAAAAIAATALMQRLESGKGRGFGSVRVRASTGGTTWSTSVFPHKGDGWLLPVQAAVRKAEGLDEGSDVRLTLHL